jgi:hypothetical protein
MDHLPTEMRFSSTARGIVIGAIAAAYAWLMHQPGASFLWALIVAAALQFCVIILRRVLPPDMLPIGLYLFELLADAGTVFLFALGIYGGLLRAGMAV